MSHTADAAGADAGAPEIREELPIEFVDGHGFAWYIERAGTTYTAGGRASDSIQQLELSHRQVRSSWDGGREATYELGGRQLRIGRDLDVPAELPVDVQRKIYVPDDQRFARFLVLITNPTDGPVELGVHLTSQLPTRSPTVLVATSDDVGAAPPVLEAVDDWVVFDDEEVEGHSAITHVFSGVGARVEPRLAGLGEGYSDWGDGHTVTFRLTVPAGGTTGIITFAVQSARRADAIAQAEWLATLPSRALHGLTADERAAVVNARLLFDADDDGLPDDREQALGTDPADPDSDGDGLTDGFEVGHCFDPLAPGEQGLDPDGDGLDNLAEQAAGSDPTMADTDGDGLTDAEEVELGTRPGSADSDRDGLGDGDEVEMFGTDPLARDSDGDGRSDGEEVTIDGTDPLVAEDVVVALPAETFDGGDFRWDIQADGSLLSGHVSRNRGTFRNAARLTVDGQRAPAVPSARPALDGRELVLGPSPTAGVELTRRIYVPAAEQFARFVDVLRNPSDAAVTVEVVFSVGMAAGPIGFRDSDGDNTLTIADDWWLADNDGDKFGGGGMSVVVILSDARAPVQPHLAQREGRQTLEWGFRVEVPAGEEVRLVHVLVQHRDGRDGARVRIDALRQWPDSVLAGISPAELSTIVNLDVAPDPR